MNDGNSDLTGREIKQPRGRRTYEALLETGFDLLRDRELDSVSVAELAREAGYSVGAFYSRFRSKDEYLDALVQRHFEQRDAAQQRLFATDSAEALIEDLVSDMVSYYWKRRGFWRSVLRRGLQKPGAWEPLRRRGNRTASEFIAAVARLAGRRLTEAEDANIRFALLIAFATINNTIANRPDFTGTPMGHREFVRQLARSFRLVSGYDAIVGIDR